MAANEKEFGSQDVLDVLYFDSSVFDTEKYQNILEQPQIKPANTRKYDKYSALLRLYFADIDEFEHSKKHKHIVHVIAKLYPQYSCSADVFALLGKKKEEEDGNCRDVVQKICDLHDINVVVMNHVKILRVISPNNKYCANKPSLLVYATKNRVRYIFRNTCRLFRKEKGITKFVVQREYKRKILENSVYCMKKKELMRKCKKYGIATGEKREMMRKLAEVLVKKKKL